jgi:hypothetical protein
MVRAARKVVNAVPAEAAASQLWRRLPARVRVPDMSRRKKWLAGIVFTLPLCLALAGCSPQPDVRLLIQPSQPLAHDCLEKLPALLPPQVSLALVRRPRPNEGAEYEVGVGESRISVFHDFGANAIELALTLQGSSSPEQKREDLALLKDVHSRVLSACNLDPGKVPVERSCTGDICKDPAYPGL